MTVSSDCPPRFASPSTGRATFGREVARLARLLGFDPMPHQERFWDLALEYDGDRFAYREVGLGLPRQNGKSTALLALMVHRCFRWPGTRVVYAAQTRLDARAKLWDDWYPLLEGSPLGELVEPYRQAGRDALVFQNGSRLSLVATSDRTGHGVTLFGPMGGAAVLDEAWALPDHRLEQSLRPAMVAQPNAQLYVVSTAGTEQRSPFLWEKVRAGRQAADAGLTEGIGYLEWSAAPDADPTDPDTWRHAMPALGRTIDEQTVLSDLRGMPRHEFERAMLNAWTTTMGDPIVPFDVWNALAAPEAPRPQWCVLGVDVGPHGRSAAIVAVGEYGDALVGSVLESGDGSEWLLSALGRLFVEYDSPQVVVDGKSVAHLLPELQLIAADRMVVLGASDVAPACSFWLRLVNKGRLRHRGERELLVALDGAAQRTLGDGWAWSRARSGADITPLVALTNAVSLWLGSWGVL
jgi:hypothetical protein